MSDQPWKIKSEIKQFKWTGKLVTFKNKDLKEALRRHFRKINGAKYNEAPLTDEELPDYFLALGYDTTHNTRTGHTTDSIHMLAGDEVIFFHLPPQFCTDGIVTEAALELFFEELKPKHE